MKNRMYNLKNLNGTLTRDEMKAIKGGDGVLCYACGHDDSSRCLINNCTCDNCWWVADMNAVCQCCTGPNCG